MKKEVITKYTILTVLFGIFIFLGIDTINHNSVTYDEHTHLVSGYSYWKTGEYKLNILDHPPLVKLVAAIPLLFMKPIFINTHPSYVDNRQYSFADFFMYNNTVDAEKMLNYARIMMLLIACLLGFAIFYWSEKIYGTVVGLIVLTLYVFSSNFIAHGILVTTDVAVSLFMFLGIYYFGNVLQKEKLFYTIMCGLMTGLALCTKFSAIIIFGIFFVIYLFTYKNIKVKNILSKSIAIFVISFLVVLIMYKLDFNLYIEGVLYVMKQIERGRSIFLFGKYTTTGFWYYFILNCLTKTPGIFILLVIISAILIKKNNYVTSVALIVPVVIYFLSASVSQMQLGLRHILPIYPFLFVLSGVGIKYILNFKNKIVGYGLIVLVSILYIFQCAKVHPWHLSYFNEIIGETKNGYKYFTDSSIDWGQGLKELGLWLKNIPEVKGIYLSFFGVGNPHYYGIKYVPIGFISTLSYEERQGDEINFVPGDKIFFAISVTNLQATYYTDKQVFTFLKKYEPIKIIADSIFVYDLTNNPEALQKIKELTMN